ncbi:hypothetical protein [Mesorhizobium retamae]|uniref:Uncharacterized protein n=1 Tax=Mesorhizobium retamae TaxID=2912854 RepID=A0ABS9QNF4_9HYPH|nr:hypothetical protein [Mesorhizobium sp. IRAMC:0171]MCG7508984.1 hypothetical protein [Mesorhizobium sp. IRAMC:0171]
MTQELRKQAEQARSNYRRLKGQRSRQNPPLDPPEFNAGDITDPTDGTLKKDIVLSGSGLTVHIPKYPQYYEDPWDGEHDTISLFWKRGADPEVSVAEILVPLGNPAQFPIPLTVPADNMRPDGIYSLKYRVKLFLGENEECLPIPLIVDTTPPWGIANPAAPDLPAEPITDEYLANNQDQVVVTIPQYPGAQKPGDRVLVWWVKEVPEDPEAVIPSAIADVGDPQVVIIPGSEIRKVGDGGCYVVYVLVDKATNASRISLYTRVAVALGALPQGLREPNIPLASDGLIDLEDAFAGVTVEIPEFQNWKSSDRVEVTWGATTVHAPELGPLPTFPIAIPIPAEVIQDEYGDAAGETPATVSYRILRGDMPFGPEQTIVQVNLSVIGPDLPDWPDPTNPNLPIATVYGEISNTENILTEDDNGKDAKFSFRLYDPCNEGELIDIYWDNTVVPEAQYTVKQGDQPGNPVDAVIPWRYIEAGGNNHELPVHYRIGAPGSPNQQRSQVTIVDVGANVITPEKPVFLKLFEDRILTCSSLDFDGTNHAVLVQVPDLSKYLADGDTVTLNWTPLGSTSGENILEDAIKEETVTLGPDHPATGFIWRVEPYDDHILPTFDPDGLGRVGRARIKYSFFYDNATRTSEQEEKLVGMYNAVGSCPLDGPTG